jgi:hypothetical protein
VAEITGIAVSTLRNDRHLRKRFPYYKIGRSIRYRLDEVLARMEQNRIEPIDDKKG